jgi:hypothetical protein
MANWRDLDDELKAWGEVGEQAAFWWRDDDAIQITSDLKTLLSLHHTTQVPLVLAVIPSQIHPELVPHLNEHDGVCVVQHGYAHQNHANKGEKSSEFPSSRDTGKMLAEIALGWSHLKVFQTREKIFVPPWNRIAADLSSGLADLGFSGISTFGSRATKQAAPALNRVNTHVDIIAWRSGRGFAGEDKVLGEVVEHLTDKRLGKADKLEPTGLLTHHLAHDPDCWKFLETFLNWTVQHEAVKWVSAEAAFRS